MYSQLGLMVIYKFLLLAANIVAPINPGSIPSVLNLVSNSHAHRTSVGGGISPVNFVQTQVRD